MSVYPFPKRALPAVDEKISAAPSCSSARIYRPDFRPAQEIEDIEAIEIVRACIRAAWGPASIEQLAKDAAKPLRTSRASIRRIMDDTTVRFDGRVGFRALAFGVGNLPPGAVADLVGRYAAAVIASERAAA
jgi:hypothetical protein